MAPRSPGAPSRIAGPARATRTVAAEVAARARRRAKRWRGEDGGAGARAVTASPRATRRSGGKDGVAEAPGDLSGRGENPGREVTLEPLEGKPERGSPDADGADHPLGVVADGSGDGPHPGLELLVLEGEVLSGDARELLGKPRPPDRGAARERERLLGLPEPVELVLGPEGELGLPEGGRVTG